MNDCKVLKQIPCYGRCGDDMELHVVRCKAGGYVPDCGLRTANNDDVQMCEDQRYAARR